MITEILPKTQLNFISEAQLNIPGFTLFTNFPLNCDLSNATTGRGVVIYLSQKLKAAAQIHYSNSDFQEHLWVKVPLKGHDTLLIGCIYRSPSVDTLSSTNSLCDLLVSLSNYTHLLICGDFNYPNIDWPRMSSGSQHSQLFLYKQSRTNIFINMYTRLQDTGTILHHIF